MPRATKKRTMEKSEPVTKIHSNDSLGTITMEKAQTIHTGDNNYTKVSLTITAPIGAGEEYMKEVATTIERISEEIDSELEYQLDELLK